MNPFLILAAIQRRIQRALWRKELRAKYPTRESFAAETETNTNTSAQLIVDAVNQGYLKGRNDGYSKGYHDGRTEEMARARQVFQEEHDKTMCEERVRRFVQ